MSISKTEHESSLTESQEEQPQTLAGMLREIHKVYRNVESCKRNQEEISRCLETLARAETLARTLGVFGSSRESLELEDISSTDIRAFAIPFFQGYMFTQLTYNERTRLVVLQAAKSHFVHYLQLCASFGVFKTDSTLGSAYHTIITTDPTSQISLVAQLQARDILVQRMKDEKLVDARIKSIVEKHTKKDKDQTKNQDEEDDGLDLSFSDEKELRELVLSQLQIFAYKAIQEIVHIEREKPMLEKQGMRADSESIIANMSDVEKREVHRAFSIEQQRAYEQAKAKAGPQTFVISPGGDAIPVSGLKEARAVLNQHTMQSAPEKSDEVIRRPDLSSVPMTHLGGVSRREELQRTALNAKPTWTVTLEEEYEREYQRLQVREARQKEYEEEQKLHPAPKEDTEEYDEQKRRADMEHDEWKAENPTGSGNRGLHS
ncbi:putative immunoglobulin-binding protein 1 [Blattamonas nauphoetae]|uniref:Immunoglobulin-binding protein 1 n=1 Tax=Blattamonas nauphoetae TaxID=2049346 RepID=A0ABQ9YM52_9EUKA|nr:putative immunoglobulin-binding protein 1 [Blattamonas nauphoetae]